MSDQSIPTVSRVLPDGTLVELLFDAEKRKTALAVCPPSGTPSIASELLMPDGETLTPYHGQNNLLTSGCIMLPSKVGDHGSKDALLADLKSFMKRYVGMSEVFEDIAVHYVLLTWVYDAFNEIPYLRFSGEFGSGKTRALLVLGSLVYKGFFASGASTVSPIFHVLHEFGGTLALDEADLRFSDATADLVKILNNGTMHGLPVLRTMTNRHRELNPKAFRVFGPKIVAMRGSYHDDALESRFITEDMNSCALPPTIPVHLPDSMKTEAQELRNRLLGWRFAMRNNVRINADVAIVGISARGNQMALPLLSLIDDPALRKAIGNRLAAAEARAAAKRSILPHVAMARVINRLFEDASHVPLSMAGEAFNAETKAGLPARSVGHIIRRELGLATVKTRGVYVVPGAERRKVTEIVERHAKTD